VGSSCNAAAWQGLAADGHRAPRLFMVGFDGEPGASFGSLAAGRQLKTRSARRHGGIVINWEAIGAIGEVVGAIAVVVTLLYLSVQLRQNTRAVEHSIQRGVHADASAWVYKLVENAELTELYRAGMNGDDLSSNDRLRFSLLMGQLVGHWNHAYSAGAFDIVDNANIPGVLAKPGGAEYWKRAASAKFTSLNPEFVRHVNQILANLEAGSSDA
jgi:hypothetical protein